MLSPSKTTTASFEPKIRSTRIKKKWKIVDNVGFSSLPEQVHRKSIKKGFEFTLLVLGDSGLGKSTLVNSLFMTNIYDDKPVENVNDRINKTVSITTRSAELEEKGVRLKLTAVDTPGFGDTLNGQDNWKTIQEYIDQQFFSYYIQENGFGEQRLKLIDTRVHCCLYFIPPNVRGLRPIDIQTMLALQKRVNIVPIIAKSDSLTKVELEKLKKNIMNDIDKYAIKLYEFPECDSDDDENFKKLDEEIKNCLPFAVIGSNTIIESSGRKIRGRIYPWGIIDIESNSCDFTKLRTFLCSSHMSDLKDLTHDLHYENYRTELMKSPKFNAVMTQARQTNGSDNIRASRRMPIEETDRLLQQKDAELKKMQELINKMKMNMETSKGLETQQNTQIRNTNQQPRIQGNEPSSNASRRHLPKNVNDLLHIPLNHRRNPLANEFLAGFKINSTPI